MPGVGTYGYGMSYPSIGFKQAQGEPRECGSPPLAAVNQASNDPTFPSWPQTKTGQYAGGLIDRPMSSDASHPILKPRPICPPSGAVQWGAHHCWWAEGDCIGQLRDTGLQCELRVLQMDGPEGPPSRQAARARGYQRLGHPILGISRS